MRILLCPPVRLNNGRFGASKVYLEFAEALTRLGWNATVVDPYDVAGGKWVGLFEQPHLLRNYLTRRAGEFDVVEYEHHQLPFPRAQFPARVLFVARSVLLIHLQVLAGYPSVPTLRGRLSRLVKGDRELAEMRRLVTQADATLAGADVINTCNAEEGAALRARGHAEDKMLLFGFGLFGERYAQFGAESEPPADPVVTFLGTFDPRKGMNELPDIVAAVARRHPRVRFRLVGTAGLVPDVAGVMRHFRGADRARLEVIPSYEPNELPRLLRGASLGIFPSRCEGFPFGVLEQLAAGLPVLAYRAPGAPELLPPELLVERGDGLGLARLAADLLGDPVRLREWRAWARQRALDFRWEDVAERTAREYTKRLARLREGNV